MSFSSTSEKFAGVLDILADELLNSTFPAQALERIRGQRLVQLTQAKAQPGAISSRVFPKVVGLVRDFPAVGSRTEGYALHDRGGRQIGVWYSSLTAGVTVDPDTHTVTISTATPWMQER